MTFKFSENSINRMRGVDDRLQDIAHGVILGRQSTLAVCENMLTEQEIKAVWI